MVDGEVVGRVTKVRFRDKNAALNMALKHLGLFDKDNAQRGANLSFTVVLV